MEQTQLRDVLRQLRDTLNFTQEEMARRMGTTVRTIARWESGPVNSLPLEMLVYLRHVAVQATRQDLADYFDGLLQKSYAEDDATELAATVHRFLPVNRRELQIVDELLHRFRNEDRTIEPVIAQIDELRKQRIEDEERKILALHLEYTKLQQALKDLGKEHQRAVEQRARVEQGAVAYQRVRVSGAEIELAAMHMPDNQAGWDIWWPRLSPNLQAIISSVYSLDEFDRVRRLAAKKPAHPDAATVRDLLARPPHKKRENS